VVFLLEAAEEIVGKLNGKVAAYRRVVKVGRKLCARDGQIIVLVADDGIDAIFVRTGRFIGLAWGKF